MTSDERTRDICLASVRRHSIDPEGWHNTVVGTCHPGIDEDVLGLLPGELVLVSCCFSPASWYAITTRRVVGAYDGRRSEVPADGILEQDFGDFKGHGRVGREILTLRLAGPPDFQFEYETGNAAMAPMYALSTLTRQLG